MNYLNDAMMNLELAKIIHNMHDLLILTWVNRLQKEVADYQKREKKELQYTVGAHLKCVLEILKTDDYSKLNEFIIWIAKWRSDMNFDLSSVQKAFLIGKEVVCESIKPVYSDDLESYLNACKEIELLFLKSLYSFSDLYERIRKEIVAKRTRELAEAEQAVIYCRQLEQEKQKLEVILSAIGAGLSLIDSDLKVLWYNEFLTKEIHFPKNRNNETCFQVYWNRNEPCEDCPARRSFESGRIEQAVRKKKMPDGQFKYFQIDTIPVRNENGQTYQVLELIRDVTEGKKLEEEFLKTERLASLGKMAAKVAHEIRNPLSSISLNTELLEDEIKSFKKVSTEEAENLLTSIMSEIDRLVSFTEEYLQFYRLPQLKFEKTCINQLILDLLEFLSHELVTNKISIRSQLDMSLPEINMDDKQIRQVLINMLRNSIEAMPQGGHIDITTHRSEDRLELQISDTGCGISKEQTSEIFDFFVSNKSGGTGLGLPLAQQIIQGHGGTITCKSELNQGTTFTIMLPLIKSKI